MKRTIILLALLVSAGLGKEIISCLDSTQEAWFYDRYIIHWEVNVSDSEYQREFGEGSYTYSTASFGKNYKDLAHIIKQAAVKRIYTIRKELLKEGKCKKVEF